MKRFAYLALLALLSLVLPVLAQAQTPPEELGLQSHTVTLSTGINMHYVEKGHGKGHVVIFLHGYTDSWRSFERNLPLISEKFHVYALDQRGHGDSSKPACCYTQDDFVADVLAFMDALKIKRATIVGHSMGSFVAHQFASEYPARVERLVLIGSAPTAAGNEVILGLNEFVQTLEDPIDPQFVREFQASTFYRPIPPEFLDTAVLESLKVPASVWKQTLTGLIAEDHTAQLGQITAPTLILWGDHDGIFTLEEQYTLAQLIPNATLKVYDETGHGLHVEWPQRFVDDLEAFAR
ncbi:MAG TPA: alpha/beta hydrolase [Herpetosiphonaceae bacterium]